MMQIAIETRLIDRIQRRQAHRHRRELPELRHEPRMRIRRQPFSECLLAEVLELFLREAPLEVGARVDPWGSVTLEEDLIASTRCILAPEEVVEANLVERSRRRIGRE